MGPARQPSLQDYERARMEWKVSGKERDGRRPRSRLVLNHPGLGLEEFRRGGALEILAIGDQEAWSLSSGPRSARVECVAV